MARHKTLVIGVWLLFMLACALIISRSQFTTDLSAFLPRTPTVQQQLLVDQLRDGLASRLILLGIEGGDAGSRAQLSRQLAQQLRSDTRFAGVNNGEAIHAERDKAYLFDHRYLLSDKVSPERFSVAGMHTAFSDSIDLLASPAGLLVKSLLPRDPTGEMMQVLEQIGHNNPPRQINGTWAASDGQRALLLVQTRASGADTDAQQLAIAAIQQGFTQVLAQQPAATQAGSKLLMTGPGVFSVAARDTIKGQVRTLSLISAAIIVALLLLLYRSPTALLLGLLPVLTGVLAAVAAVSLGFGVVHGITLGFGTALIGEAVDYSIYLFVQTEPSDQISTSRADWVRQFWPTVRLGVLTSVFGFASLLLSGLPGLAQLGLYAIAGLIAAAAVTRFVLPHMLPANFRIYDVSHIGNRLGMLAQKAARLRWWVLAMLLLASVVIYQQRTRLWNHELSSLSPISAAEQALDARLRADMGAPDVRYLIVVTAASQEAALLAAEQVSAQLQPLVAAGELGGFDSPSRYLPSNASQRARLASLPDAATLMQRLPKAIAGLPVRTKLFEPFIADVTAARTGPILQRSDLDNTSMAMAVDGLLLQQGERWSALLPLTASAAGSMPAERVSAALDRAAQSNALFIDLKAEADQLYAGYLDEAIKLALGGLLAIVALLLFTLRSARRVLQIIAPLAAAVLCVIAGLILFGQQLIILHLVGLLLVVAIGSNYALFFDSREQNIPPRTLAALLFANLATVAGFGLLAFSTVPVLQALGITVAPGVILALVFSAILGGYREHKP